MLDLTLEALVFRTIAAIPLIVIHGLAIAALARILGDRGVAYDGRLSINPARHADTIGLLALVVVGLGWSKPVAVDPKELRWGSAGLVAIAVVGLIVTMAVVSLILLLRPLVLSTVGEPETARIIVGVLNALAQLTAGFIILNLVPLPPLTGGLVLQAVAPRLFETLAKRSVAVSLVIAAGLVLLAYVDRAQIPSAIQRLATLLSGNR